MTPILLFTFSILIPESILALVRHRKYFVRKITSPIQLTLIFLPIKLAPFAGALLGALIYDAFLFLGEESIINTPNTAAKAHFEVIGRAEGSAAGRSVAADAV